MKRPEPPARPSNPSEFQDADVTFDRLLDEIGDRINRHQAVDLEQYTREHPELADRLRKAVTGLMLVAECAPNLSDTPETSLPTDRTLGDYRLMRQIGSGGMGVVYEAEQLSLGRRVALKVLPFAAVLDQRQLTRFQNEARAAATLDHPHIVSVYGVGQERGVYYYAMQLIEGQSLAQVIAQRLHDEEAEVASRGADLAPATAPDQSTLRAGATTTLGSHDESAYLRDVARVAAEAAEALDYAHQQGVVHRDIKPANLLVDRSGRLYVTDFGLARIDANPSITATGNVIGTMRYMSPEQALAKRDVVDHRTDVFSLGATLYELITLRPARDGEARHDVVRQIGAETPPAPRSLCPRIPQALETIVLKAMALRVADRYETAAELAHDLRNFLQGKPIVGRRPSRLRRIGDWITRHRLSATLLAALAALISTLAIAGPIAAHRYAALAHQESTGRHELEQLLTETLTNATESLENAPFDAEVHPRILKGTAQQYETLLERVDDRDVSLKCDIAWGYFRLGRVIAFVFDKSRGQRIADRACVIMDDFARRHPENADYQYRLATMLRWRSTQLRDGNLATARSLGGRGVHIMERLVLQHPESEIYRSQWIECLVFQAHLLCEGGTDLVTAEQMYESAHNAATQLTLETPGNEELYAVLALAKQSLASYRLRQGNLQAAEKLYREYEELGDHVSPRIVGVTRNRVAICSAMLGLSRTLRQLGQLEESERYLRKYAAEIERVVSDFPNLTWAKDVYVALQLELVDLVTSEHPERDDLQAMLEATLANIGKGGANRKQELRLYLGNVLYYQGHVDRARECYQTILHDDRGHAIKSWLYANSPVKSLRDLGEAERLVASFPPRKRKQREITSAILAYRREDYETAREQLRNKAMLPTDSDPTVTLFAAMSEFQLGNKRQANEIYETAKREFLSSSGQTQFQLWSTLNEAAELLGDDDPIQLLLRDDTSHDGKTDAL